MNNPQVVGGRFLITRRLARTAHSIVDLAYDTIDHQAVVIKRLAPTPRGLPARSAARAFLREIKIVQSLPSDIPVTLLTNQRRSQPFFPFPIFITMGRDQAGYYYAQRYIPGETLASILAAGRPRDYLRIAINLCRVLRRLHRCGIVHGDLHPQNIIVSPRAEVSFIDFGLSRYRNQSIPELVGVGRPGYTPPEQLHGVAVDERADLFALGMILEELLPLAELPDTVAEYVMRLQQPLPAHRDVTLSEVEAELTDALRADSLLVVPPRRFITALTVISAIIIAIFWAGFCWR